jgi:hypothetical protein
MKKTVLLFVILLIYTTLTGQNRNLINKTPDIIFDGETLMGSDTIDYRLGYFVDGAGDINNDGYDDLVLAAPGFNFDRGKLLVLYGQDSTSGTIAPTHLPGNDYYDELGYRVSKAGDINGDGYADIIAGAVKYNNFQGKALVYYGSAAGIADSTVLTVNSDSCHFGCAVGGGGDFNGDGFDDIIVGAIHFGELNGKAFLFLGNSNGIETAPAMTLSIPGGRQNLFGWSVAFAGDVNNDGFDDLLVGAVKSNSFTGKMFLFLGGSVLDSLPDFVFTGENEIDQLGWDVSGAGDIDNDGYDDFMVSATYFDDSTGRVYVFKGAESFQPGYAPAIVLTGDNTDEYFGRSIRCAGDVNADGYDDIIIGIMRYENYTGKAYLFLGNENFDLYPEIKLYGETTMNYFGKSLSGAGDFNGDGVDDIIVGAWKYNQWRGRAYLYLGSSLITSSGMQNKVFPEVTISPVPFRTKTSIHIINLPNRKTEVSIYNMQGVKIETLFNGYPKSSTLSLTWYVSDENISKGTYICIVKTENYLKEFKLIYR